MALPQQFTGVPGIALGQPRTAYAPDGQQWQIAPWYTTGTTPPPNASYSWVSAYTGHQPYNIPLPPDRQWRHNDEPPRNDRSVPYAPYQGPTDHPPLCVSPPAWGRAFPRGGPPRPPASPPAWVSEPQYMPRAPSYASNACAPGNAQPVRFSNPFAPAQNTSHARRRPSMSRAPRPNLRRRSFSFSRNPRMSGNEWMKLSARPYDWRPDYTPRPGSKLSRRLSRVRASVGTKRWRPRLNYTLTPLLLLTDPTRPPVTFDLRLPPSTTDIWFPHLNRESNALDLWQLATAPPVDELCLWHPALPWYVHIRAARENGITLQDVFLQMYEQLMEPVGRESFWNEVLDSADRERITAAAWARRGVDPYGGGAERPVSKIDYLGFDFLFLGLVKSKDGMWEMKTAPC